MQQRARKTKRRPDIPEEVLIETLRVQRGGSTLIYRRRADIFMCNRGNCPIFERGVESNDRGITQGGFNEYS